MEMAGFLKCFAIPFLACATAWSAGYPHGAMLRGPRAHSSFPFQAAGVFWHDPSTRTVRARASIDGLQWTPWIDSHAEVMEGDRVGSGLVYFGEGYRYVETDGVAEPEILLIDAGPSPARPSDISAPTMITREQWGCTPNTCPVKDPPLYTTVTHLIVHHTDNLNTATDWAAVVRAIWVLHVQGNGWNDIGYNYLIDPDGLLYEGRAGGDGVLGAHFSGVNSGTMGVALLGTYIDVPPPPPMLDTLEAMLAWQANKWHLDPGGERLHTSSGLVLNVISGHRDASISPKASGTTECPGNTAYSFLPLVRDDVVQRIPGCHLSIGERNRCVGAEGGALSLSIVSSSPSNCTSAVSIPTAVDWVTSDLVVAPNPGPRRGTTVDIGGLALSITQSGKDEPALPCIAMRGIVNGANFDPRPVAAGSQMAIFGDHFDAATSVVLNGTPVSIEYAGPTQINARLPSNVKIGTNHLTVTANGVTGPETNFWVTEAMPAIFATTEQRAIAINVEDNTPNSAQTPVRAGAPLVFYVTGIGPDLPWSASVGGKAAVSSSIALVPSLPGVYQVNISVPADLLTGDYPLTVTADGVISREAILSVKD
jgi:uncharacterized protein (TIGR03437 family)